MKAAIFSTGDELVNGKTLDTNAHWLSSQLTELDVEIVCQINVGDDKSQIIWGLEQATRRADIVIMTGGLGPTDDDLTRFAIADFTKTELSLDENSLKQIKDLFESRNYEMCERNNVQAMIPNGAEVLANPTGTAPGIKMLIGGSMLFSLPGVPREMKIMFDLYVKTWVETQTRSHTFRRRLQSIGVGESTLAHKLEDLIKAYPDVALGTTANEGIVSLNLAGKNKSSVIKFEHAIKEKLGNSIFGFGDQTLPEVVGGLLRNRNETLATAESCTGGLIGKQLTDIPGSSSYYLGGFVCYSNELKESLVGVSNESLKQFGAVSEQVARELSQGTLAKTNADWAIGVTGIAGPGGKSPKKPEGLVYISLAGKNGVSEVKKCLFGNPGRKAVRLRTAMTALEMLREALM
jgi:competence/damage-inducible protein CinA-like protein